MSGIYVSVWFVVLALPFSARAHGSACKDAFDCSLNGECQGSTCVCYSPWGGEFCQTLQYAETHASAKNLWTGSGTNESLNTWNGPIMRGVDGVFHLFDPVYEHGSLWHVKYYAHGNAANIEGPYNWSNPTIASTIINPGGLTFKNETTGKMVYSLWMGGDIYVSDDADGPYASMYKNPMSGNTAPAYFNGSIYVTNQRTQTIMSAKSIAGPWSTFANIPHQNFNLQYNVEDPFMYIDARKNFHIINHAYNTRQTTNCTSSWVSSHFFSSDGERWGHTDQPYGHTVHFDDGTSHSYCTLERPSLNFDASGQLTHIHFAADLVTEDTGCASRGKGCVDCKYDDHAGTLLVKLGA